MSHLPRQHFQPLFISPALRKQKPGALCNAYVRGAKGTLPRLCSCSGATTDSPGLAAEGNAAIHMSFPWTRRCLSPRVTHVFLQWLSEVLGCSGFLPAVFIVTSAFSGFALSLLLLNCMGKSKGSRCQMCLKSIARGCLPGAYTLWQGFLITALISIPLF